MKRSVSILILLAVVVLMLSGCTKTGVLLAPAATTEPTDTPADASATPAVTEMPTATPAAAQTPTDAPTEAPTPEPTETPAPPTPTVSSPNADVVGLWTSDDGTSTVEFYSDGTATIVNSGESMSGDYTYDQTTLSGRITIPEGYWLFDLSPDKSTLSSIIKQYHRS